MTIEDGCQCCYCRSLRTEEATKHRGAAITLQDKARRISANAMRVSEKFGNCPSYWEGQAVRREQGHAAKLYQKARDERDKYLKLEKML